MNLWFGNRPWRRRWLPCLAMLAVGAASVGPAAITPCAAREAPPGGQLSGEAAAPSVAEVAAAWKGARRLPVSGFLAQFESAPTGPAGGGQAMNWRILIKIAIIVVVGFVAAMVSFFVVFPARLRRLVNPTWPVTLYGRCAALATFLTAMAALGVLWEDLAFPDETGGVNFVREHGARLAILAVGLVLPIVWMALWRSDVPKEQDATQLSRPDGGG